MIQPQAVSLHIMKAFLQLGRTRKLREEVEISRGSFIGHALAPEFALIADALDRMEEFERVEGPDSCHELAMSAEQSKLDVTADELSELQERAAIWVKILGAAAHLPTAYQTHLLCHGIHPSDYRRIAA